MPGSETLGGRVVVADDDGQTRNLLRELCEGWGFEVLPARDGAEAFSLCCDERPDLALLDLMMPKLDGYEVLRRLRARDQTRELPVIVLTAIGDVDGKIRGIELGADDYITKPFRIADLNARITAVLDKRRQKLAPSAGGSALDDPLTLTGSIPQLKETLEAELARARERNLPLSALIAAIDDDPLVLEGISAEAANEVFSKLGQLLKRSFREHDRTFRIDIEAFVVLLPQAKGEDATRAAERLVKSVQDARLQAPGRPHHMTISVGVADFPAFGGSRPEELIHAAYQALRQARRAGAARVDLAQPAAAQAK